MAAKKLYASSDGARTAPRALNCRKWRSRPSADTVHAQPQLRGRLDPLTSRGLTPHANTCDWVFCLHTNTLDHAGVMAQVHRQYNRPFFLKQEFTLKLECESCIKQTTFMLSVNLSLTGLRNRGLIYKIVYCADLLTSDWSSFFGRFVPFKCP
ncbi:hypothetical protein B5X24_HaOG216575 [Helicoverpa armigera]|nr:hypothetical protein B5X24_HaOG216575 [Helicoverpa armigera]